jgi:hypothetical protein
MHGQKKRRKRSMDGVLTLDGSTFLWCLLSEPQWTTEDGYRGLCFSVRAEDGQHRELALQFPMPRKSTGNGMPQLPQRPNFSEQEIESGIRQALAAGWDPLSRGKIFRFEAGEALTGSTDRS